MKKVIMYKDEECVVIKTIQLSEKRFTFFVGVNTKKIIYLKENYIHDRISYVSLEKLVHLFPEYQNPSMFNIKVLLDTFVNTVNYKISIGEIVDSDEILEIIFQFEKIISDPYIRKMTNPNNTLIFNKQAMFEVTNTIKKLDGKFKKTTLMDLLKTNEEVGTTNDIFLSENWLDYKSNKDIVYESIRKSNEKHRKSPIDWLFNNKVLNIYMVIIVLCSVVFASCLGMLYEWKKTGDETKDELKDIYGDVLVEETIDDGNFDAPDIDYIVASDNSKPTNVKNSGKYGNDYWNYLNTPLINVNFNKLKQTNSDTVAWLYVNNTNINYPIVQTRNNTYYLNHSFNKKVNVAGWLYGDYRSNFDKFKRNTVIYGHGRVDQVMFGSLEKTLSKSWYTNKNNYIIKMSTPTSNTLWHIVSIYVVPAEAYYLTHNFENDEAYQKWINKMLSRSVYNFGIPVSTKDKFLTLSTCKDYNGNRIVVQAKLVKSSKK